MGIFAQQSEGDGRNPILALGYPLSSYYLLLRLSRESFVGGEMETTESFQEGSEFFTLCVPKINNGN